MTEYICRDKVLSYVYATHSAGGFRNEEDYLWLQEAVVDAAAADVQPVRRGRWIKERIDDEKSLLYGAIKNIKCSVCNRGGLNISFFCPNCGARMDKEGNNGKSD